MNQFKRSRSMMMALVLASCLVGCATPAQARTLDLNAPQVVKFGTTETLLASRGNMYHIDSNISPSSTFMTVDPSVAVAYINPRTMDLLIDARKPGMTDLYYSSDGKLMRLQIIVR